MADTLAIYGGTPAVDVSKVINWPPIDEIDEKMVLDALHQPNQARGVHNLAFEKEFARIAAQGAAQDGEMDAASAALLKLAEKLLPANKK